MHATPGDMKSFRSSADRMALIVSYGGGGVASVCYEVRSDRRRQIEWMQQESSKHMRKP